MAKKKSTKKAKSKASAKKKPARVNTVVHAILEVADIEKSKRFYKNALGLELEFEDKKHNYVQFKTQGISGLGLFQKSSGSTKQGGPTVLVLNTNDIHKTFKELSARGVWFVQQPNKTWWGAIYAEFIDPDRIRWGLVQAPKK